MKRLFAAIKVMPDEEFMRVFMTLKRDLKNEKIKWVDPENIHITLKFFGETPESKIPLINDVLSAVATDHRPFAITFAGAGIFGSSYNPRVIWLGIAENGELINLGMNVLKYLDDAGWPRDRQNFIPHITLGRIKQVGDKQELKQVVSRWRNHEIQKMDVGQFYLFESILRPNGPVYMKLSSFALV
jgi:RNA 2',3'-cyclic 3'-phosphodiesterase